MISNSSMECLMSQVFSSCQLLREAGQREYAHNEDNVHANFERLGAELRLPREEVLWIYLRKHLDGILAWIKGHTSQRESVHGRIRDAIVYLCLLDAMATDDEAKFAIAAEEETK